MRASEYKHPTIIMSAQIILMWAWACLSESWRLTHTCMDFIYHRHRHQTANVNSNSKCIHTPRLQPALLAGGLVQLSTEIFPFWKMLWIVAEKRPGHCRARLQTAVSLAAELILSMRAALRCVSLRSLSSSRITSGSISIPELLKDTNKCWASLLCKQAFNQCILFLNAMILLYVVCRVR